MCHLIFPIVQTFKLAIQSSICKAAKEQGPYSHLVIPFTSIYQHHHSCTSPLPLLHSYGIPCICHSQAHTALVFGYKAPHLQAISSLWTKWTKMKRKGIVLCCFQGELLPNKFIQLGWNAAPADLDVAFLMFHSSSILITGLLQGVA